MKEEELQKLLKELIKLPKENEIVEFKENYFDPEEIGQYISALSNSACLHKKEAGYLVYGIENKTHKVKGTTFKPKSKKVKGEELENWICRQLDPKIDFKIFQFKYKNYKISMFKIDPANTRPVKFKEVAYIRVGSYKKRLSDYPEKERKI